MAMTYMYKTWKYDPTEAVGNQETYVENLINRMVADGWEYTNAIATGVHAFVLLVFRKPK